MDAKDAVEIGKNYIKEIYASENVYNVGLEEVDFDIAKGFGT